MKRLVNEFRDYARLPAAELKPVDLNALVTDVLHLYPPETRRRVALRSELDERCPPIRADEQQIRQVIHNLLQNAQDAAEATAARHRAAGRSRHPHPAGGFGPARAPHRAGQRPRLCRAHPQARLRALRHDQGQGHRAGPGGRQENRRRARRADRTFQPHRRWGCGWAHKSRYHSRLQQSRRERSLTPKIRSHPSPERLAGARRWTGKRTDHSI